MSGQILVHIISTDQWCMYVHIWFGCVYMKHITHMCVWYDKMLVLLLSLLVVLFKMSVGTVYISSKARELIFWWSWHKIWNVNMGDIVSKYGTCLRVALCHIIIVMYSDNRLCLYLWSHFHIRTQCVYLICSSYYFLY